MKLIMPVLIIFGITAMRDLLEGGQLRLSVVVGSFLAGLAFYGVDAVSPELALALAWVTAITAVILNGEPVFKAINEGL